MFRLSLAALLCVSACGGSSSVPLDAGEDTPTIASVTPDFAPLTGGTRVVIQGRGFLHGNAPPNRVLIGGIECEAAGVIDDQNIEVIVPPGADYGEVDVVVFNLNGNATGTGLFHYSSAPAITGVSPATTDYVGGETLTISGSGFLDEDAGPVTVFVNGERMFGIDVVDDGTITFEAPPGGIASTPDISLENDRGEAGLADAYQYSIDGTTSGLWIFNADTGGSFGAWFDPASSTLTLIPRTAASTGMPALRATAHDADGDVWGMGRDNRLYEFEPGAQLYTLVGNTAGGVPTMTFHDGHLYAHQRCSQLLEIDPTTGQATLISSALTGCMGGGFASDGTTLYAIVSDGTSIAPVVLPAGTLGTGVTLTPALTPFHIGSAAYHAGILYAVATNQGTRASKLVTVDPTSGVVTDVVNLPFHTSDILDAP